MAYPEGITSADHIAHDMRAGRFPKQSTIAEFLDEVRNETDRDVLARCMSEPTIESCARATINATRIRNAARAALHPTQQPPHAGDGQ